MDERKLIYADDAIEAIEEITWYHQNINNEMVRGANSSEDQAWYKAEDVYEALEQLPSVQPEHLVKKTGNLVNGLVNDCISRQAAIDAVHKEFDECLVWDESGKHTADEVERVLTDVPSAQPEHTGTHSCDYQRAETHGWIPVSEALPEDACQCIVTAKVKHVDNYPDYEVDTANFADGIFTTDNSWWGVESIIAWMPLPEPWREQE